MIDILRNRLLPLMDHQSEIVRKSASNAISAFPITEIYSIIPQAPDFVLKTKLDINLVPILASLIIHECKTMGRAIFKGAGEKVSQSSSSSITSHITKDLNSKWNDEYATGNLRTGYAIFKMYLGSDLVNGSLMDSTMITRLIAELPSPTASNIMDLIESFTAYWEMNLLRLAASNAINITGVISIVFDELMNGVFNSSNIPAHQALVIVAICGLAISASKENLLSSVEQSRLIFALTKRLERKAISEICRGCISLALAFISTISDYPINQLQMVWDCLVSNFISSRNKYQFLAFSTGLGMALLCVPQKLDNFNLFFKITNDSGNWISCGAGIGFSLIMDVIFRSSNQNKLRPIIECALKCLKNGQECKDDDQLISSMWICSKSIIIFPESRLPTSGYLSALKDCDAAILSHAILAQARMGYETGFDLLKVYPDHALHCLRFSLNLDYKLDCIPGSDSNELTKTVSYMYELLQGAPASSRSVIGLCWIIGVCINQINKRESGIIMSSSDPKDLSRLADVSYLRSSFQHFRTQPREARYLFDAFHASRCKLPNVDWTGLVGVSENFKNQDFEFVCMQCDSKSPKSLIKIFIDMISQYANSSFKSDSIVMRLGVPRLLQLGGISDDGESVLTSVFACSVIKKLLRIGNNSLTQLVIDTIGKTLTKSKLSLDLITELLSYYLEMQDICENQKQINIVLGIAACFGKAQIFPNISIVNYPTKRKDALFLAAFSDKVECPNMSTKAFKMFQHTVQHLSQGSSNDQTICILACSLLPEIYGVDWILDWMIIMCSSEKCVFSSLDTYKSMMFTVLNGPFSTLPMCNFEWYRHVSEGIFNYKLGIEGKYQSSVKRLNAVIEALNTISKREFKVIKEELSSCFH